MSKDFEVHSEGSTSPKVPNLVRAKDRGHGTFGEFNPIKFNIWEVGSEVAYQPFPADDGTLESSRYTNVQGDLRLNWFEKLPPESIRSFL